MKRRDIVIVGDTHAKSSNNGIFFKGLKKLFYWILEQYPDCVLVQTGDLVDAPTISWTLFDEVSEILKLFYEVHIVTGNHELLSRAKGNPIRSLRHHSNIRIYEEKAHADIEGYDFLMMPFLADRKKMKEYENPETCDFAVTHFSPPGLNFGIDEYDLSLLNTKAVFYGHIHESRHTQEKKKKSITDHIVCGVPQTTRNLEQDFSKYAYLIRDEKIETISLPTFMTIETVKYGETPTSEDNLINIINAPSVQDAFDKYKEYEIRDAGIKLLRTEADTASSTETHDSFSDDLPKKWLAFAKDRNYSQEVVETALRYL